MKIFILTSNNFTTELFNNFEDVLKRLNELKEKYKNKNFSLFGRPYEMDEDTSEVYNLPYLKDSVLFATEYGYKEYFIERISTKNLKTIDFED